MVGSLRKEKKCIIYKVEVESNAIISDDNLHKNAPVTGKNKLSLKQKALENCNETMWL